MPTQLLKDNVYKYSTQKKEISLYCCETFTLFEKSFRKLRQLYLTDQAIYVISHKKLKIRIPLESISKAYVGLLAGDLFLVTDKKNLIIDCAEGRTKFIENIKHLSPNCQIEYVNYTMLDFLFEKHKKINSKVKMTEYDPNQKKVQLKYITGQKLNLKQLRLKWEEKSSSNGQSQTHKKWQAFELTQVILTNTYWNMFVGKLKESTKQYTIKVYSKKFIGMQDALLNSILNQRRFLEQLTTSYTPSLLKAFCSPSNIYLVFEYFNGYLLQVFTQIKKHKIVNLLSQIVVSVGQLHEAGIVYGNLSKNGVMIDINGYPFLFNMGLCVERGKQIVLDRNVMPPQTMMENLPKAQFAYDWWNLAQLIFELVQKRPFYEKKTQQQIESYLKDPSDALPSFLSTCKLQKQQQLYSLFLLLLKKNPSQRLGYKNDYHQILHHKYFEQFLKGHSKSGIMKRKCPPVFKKVSKPAYDEKKLKQIQKEFILDEDWSEMDGYLKEFEYVRDVD